MTFWSTERIVEDLPSGTIEPYSPERIASGAYELRLGGEWYSTAHASAITQTIPEGGMIAIESGHFALLVTAETLSMPSETLGLLSMRYHFKRAGLVNVSGFHVDPGFNGRLVFGVYNAGPRRVTIRRGERLFLLWFADLDRPTTDLYRGSRDGVDGITSDDVNSLEGEVHSPHTLGDRIANLERQVRMRYQVATVVVAAALGVIGTLVVDAITK